MTTVQRENPYIAERQRNEEQMHHMTRVTIQQAIKEGRIDELPKFYRNDPHYADLFPKEEKNIFPQNDDTYEDINDTEANGWCG